MFKPKKDHHQASITKTFKNKVWYSAILFIKWDPI